MPLGNGELKNNRIRNSKIETAFTDGEFKGRAEGHAEGLEKGEAIGIAKGEYEKTVALNLLKMGVVS